MRPSPVPRFRSQNQVTLSCKSSRYDRRTHVPRTVYRLFSVLGLYYQCCTPVRIGKRLPAFLCAPYDHVVAACAKNMSNGRPAHNHTCFLIHRFTLDGTQDLEVLQCIPCQHELSRCLEVGFDMPMIQYSCACCFKYSRRCHTE